MKGLWRRHLKVRTYFLMENSKRPRDNSTAASYDGSQLPTTYKLNTVHSVSFLNYSSSLEPLGTAFSIRMDRIRHTISCPFYWTLSFLFLSWPQHWAATNRSGRNKQMASTCEGHSIIRQWFPQCYSKVTTCILLWFLTRSYKGIFLTSVLLNFISYFKLTVKTARIVSSSVSS
jgi:hypothetical protein